jgi:hypothetical protein
VDGYRTMATNLQNRLAPRNFSLDPRSPAFEHLAGHSGVVPLSTVLDPEVGEEVLLAILDDTEFAHEIAALAPFTLRLNSGAVRTGSGPIVYLLFWLQSPDNPATPFAMWDVTVDPNNERHLEPLRRLARQTHWHVVVCGTGGDAVEVLDLFEFENSFRLDAALVESTTACAGLPTSDFDQAKLEYESTYDLPTLFSLGTGG